MPLQTANITLIIGDHDVDVYVAGVYPHIDDWRIYRGARRLRGLERWIARNGDRLERFLEDVYGELNQ